jgi:hypothetical protein
VLSNFDGTLSRTKSYFDGSVLYAIAELRGFYKTPFLFSEYGIFEIR